MNLKFEDYLMIKHVYDSIVKMFKEKIEGETKGMSHVIYYWLGLFQYKMGTWTILRCMGVLE